MQYRDVPVVQLDLDVKNPRHGEVPSQDDAFRALAREQGPKLIALALDIHENALHPANRLIVMRGAEERYIVLDGNRRLAALRLLADPTLLPPDDVPGDLVERLSSGGQVPSIVACCVFESRRRARLWLERTHSGEQGGIGVISWSATAKVRFSPGRPDQASRGIAAVDWLRARTGDDAELQQQLLHVEDRITNLGRLVSDPYVRNRLGFNFFDNTIVANLSENAVIENLTIVVSDLASGTSVTQLKSKDLRRNYIDDLIPSPDEASPSEDTEPTPHVTPTPSTPAPPTPPATPSKPSTPKPSTPQLHLFDNASADGLSHRIRLVLDEVKSINVTLYPNAAAILVRCTIDMAVADYRTTKSLPDKRSLLKNIRSTINHLGIAQDDPRYHGIRTTLDSPNSLFSAENLHQYVHNLDTHPIPSDLVQITRNYAPFIEDISLALQNHRNSV